MERNGERPHVSAGSRPVYYQFRPAKSPCFSFRRSLISRPLHGWRAFAGEVGVVVFGVLIALGASQLVDAWQWRQQVKQANDDFKDELLSIQAAAYWHLAAYPCVATDLSRLESKLSERSVDWSRVEIYPSTYPPVPMTTEEWDNAVATGTLNHLPHREEASLSRAYAAARQFVDDRRRINEPLAKLAPLREDRRLSSETRFSLVQTAEEVRRLDEALFNDSQSILCSVQGAGLGYTHDWMRKDNADNLKTLRAVRGQCVTEPDIPECPPG